MDALYVPSDVKNLVFDLFQECRVSQQRPEDVQQLYEVTMKEVTDKYFSSSPWPAPELIAEECQNDQVFLYFYKDISYRHLFTTLTKNPTLQNFSDSWDNYCHVFDWLLSVEDTAMIITIHWAYDFVQEFVYKFQGFCQFRSQLSSRNADDIQTLKNKPHIWALPMVVSYLRRTIAHSKVTQVLQTRRTRGLQGAEDELDPLLQAPSEMTLMLGYFCITELARLKCLIGDYEDSIAVLEPIAIGNRFENLELFKYCVLCDVTLHYHMGVCYLMSRRYSDAIAVFSDLLLQVHRVIKPGASALRQSTSSMIMKIFDRTLSLTCVCMYLCPGFRVDDQVRVLVTDKCGDKCRRLELGDVTMYEDMVAGACPKFVSPSMPDYTNGVYIPQGALQHQVGVLMTDIRQQLSFQSLRAYMKLYSSIDLNKMAHTHFSEAHILTLLSKLLSFKHKMSQLQREDVAGSHTHTLVRRLASDVHYYVEDTTLHVDDVSTRTHTIESVFMSGIHKHGEIIKTLRLAFDKCVAPAAVI